MSDNYNEFGEETASSKKRRYISYAITLVVIVVLGVIIFVGKDAERDGDDDTEVMLDGYEEIDDEDIDESDETLRQYIQNIREEIEYIFTSEMPAIEALTEQEIAKNCYEIRNKIGKQVICSESVGYRDKSLCSDGESYILMKVRVEDIKANKRTYQLKFNPSKRSSLHGYLDYYTAEVKIEEIEE